MYLNGLLQSTTDILQGLMEDSAVMELGANIFTILITIVLFVFKAIAIYTMAKRRSFNNLWMAFVPFLNYVLLGKLIGNVVVWGKKVKNLGLLLCIVSAVSSVLYYAINAGYYISVIEATFQVKFAFASAFITSWVQQTTIVWDIFRYVYYVVSIITTILECWVIFSIFRKYAPERSLMYSLISIFTDLLLFPIFLFVIRNRKVVTFEDFLRTRNRYYTQNPNGGYNQNSNGGYNGGYYSNPTPPTNEVDPFPEFSNKPKNTDNGYSSTNPYERANETQNSNTNDSKEDDLFN